MKEIHHLSATYSCIIKNTRHWMGECLHDVDVDRNQISGSLIACQHQLERSIERAMTNLIMTGCQKNLEVDLKIDHDCLDLRHYIVKNPIATLGFTVGNMSIEENRILNRNIFYETTTVVRSIVYSDIYDALT